MLDIKFVKENKELILKNNRKRGAKVDIDKMLKLFDESIELLKQIEEGQKIRNQRSKTKPTADEIKKGKSLNQKIKELKDKYEEKVQAYQAIFYQIPNLTHKDVPEGDNESGNVSRKQVGKKPEFDFKPKDHIELGKSLDIIDVEKSAEVSGSRFCYLKNEAALLQFALIQYALDTLTNETILKKIAKATNNPSSKIFTPVIPPTMIKLGPLTRMRRLEPKEDRYFLEKDELFLVGSAEHTLGPLLMDQTVDEENLPIRYVGYSTAFRREAGSHGKDVKGILRAHQFDKLEIESFTTEENGLVEQDFIVALQEYLLSGLGISYQVVDICTGDMGAPDYRQIDIECWIPSQNKYRETHTSDYVADYQALTLEAKWKDKGNKKRYLHMNDATVFAIGRTLIAIIENYQTKDGSVKIPKVLHQYLNFKEIKKK